MKAETILAGCGAGVLFTLQSMAPLLSPNHLVLYHSRLPIPSVAWGILIDLAVVSLLLTLLLGYLEKSRSGRLNPGWALLGAALAAALVAACAAIGSQPVPHRDFVRAVGGTLLLALALRWLRPSLYRMFSRGLLAVFLLAGFSIVWIVPQVLYLSFQRPPLAPGGAVRTAARTSPEFRGRIVWLLFDELSYDQTFGHRVAGLSMPAFDEFRRSSFVFENLKPAGYYTELVIPSLFLGNIVDGLKSNMKGMPALRIAGQSGWHDFDRRKAIFFDAERAGWTTGVVGWYNPYCRILAGTLDYCYAQMENREASGMTPGNTALENAITPVEVKIRALEHKPTLLDVRQKSGFPVLMRQARALLRDEKVRFVFIHLSVPHPPGIYDRTTGLLRNGGSYIDNLALADRSLGELMTVLNATASAPATTVIVCSDHSWRVPIWRSWPGWTKEEEAASRGKFDPRPMLMIHFPSQVAEMSVKQPFGEIGLHQILVQMVHGEMRSPGTLVQWLQRAAGSKPAAMKFRADLTRP